MEEINKWIEAYDLAKYPVGIYEELVVEQMDHSRKFELMGAWKTGALRLSDISKEYSDKNGQYYEFTKRWKASAPVGYETWKEISNNQSEIKKQIPELFPRDKPPVVKDLEHRKGFGYIWTIFVLHCFYPNTYPLYDQHVYRAYERMSSNQNKIINQAPNTWKAYTSYRNFFTGLLTKTGLPFWELDRALWAYGKKIKQDYKFNDVNHKIQTTVKQKIILDDSGSNAKWLHDHTLGGKAKPFYWRMDEDNNMLIKREINKKITLKTIPERELNFIHKYVTYDKWKDLANNVVDLTHNNGKEGLGKFLRGDLNWSIIDAQLASQLVVIFLRPEIWRYNGKKKGIQFIRQNDDWKNRLNNFYTAKINYL